MLGAAAHRSAERERASSSGMAGQLAGRNGNASRASGVAKISCAVRKAFDSAINSATNAVSRVAWLSMMPTFPALASAELSLRCCPV